MKSTRKLKCFFCIVFLFFITSISWAEANRDLEIEEQEYRREYSRIKEVKDSLKPGLVNNLEDYKKFADEIQEKWKGKDKESYGRLMLEICEPLSSGSFKSDRRYDFARDYALSALTKHEEISLDLELELIGNIITNIIPNKPKDEELVKRRKEDTEIRLHAWRRLLDAIDPEWDPNDLPYLNVPPPLGATISAGASPQHIKDPKLRAEYEAAIETNRIKSERYLEQSDLRKWLKRYPKRAEEYIVYLYSEKPYNLEELTQLLEKYKIDKETQTRITEAVTKNMDK